MCLETVTSKPKPWDKTVRTGYKVMYRYDSGNYACEYMGKHYSAADDDEDDNLDRNEFQVGMWYRDTNSQGNYYISKDMCYKLGYHVFATKKGALQWAHGDKRSVVKVKFSNVCAIGSQYVLNMSTWKDHRYKVYVARRMMVVGPAYD